MVFLGEVMVMTMMLSLTLKMHWHGLVVQRYGSNHLGIVFFGGFLRCAPTLIKNVSFVEEWEKKN